jgi:hypothetical protein
MWMNTPKTLEWSDFNLNESEKLNKLAEKDVSSMSEQDLINLSDKVVAKVNVWKQWTSKPDIGSELRNDIPTNIVQPSKPGSIPERVIVDWRDQDWNTYTKVNKNQVQNNETWEIINVFNG